MPDVTITGWVLANTKNGGAVIFAWEHRALPHETVILPKKLIKVDEVDEGFMDAVTMPEWLAKDRGLCPGLRENHS